MSLNYVHDMHSVHYIRLQLHHHRKSISKSKAYFIVFRTCRLKGDARLNQ